MVDIGNLIRAAHHLSLQRLRNIVAGVTQNTQPHLMGQIQPGTVLFQHVHDPQTLLIVAEGLADAAAQGVLSGMAKGGMPQVVSHGNRLGQILIQAQRPDNGARNPGHLQRMGHAGTVMVSLRA